ncbi:MAG: sulfurtransferase TusA family protein [Acidobacteria bacterium]|nr:sulfurtransferase TusA family protein [Acidobacteriota bacterium]
MSQSFDKLLDARGLNCPMPLVNARKEAGNLEPGQVLKIIATDRGSVADFQGWAKIAKDVELVGQDTESVDGADVFVHYIKRTS